MVLEKLYSMRDKTTKLTLREFEVLWLIAHDYNRKNIEDILDICNTRVNQLVKAIKKRLKVYGLNSAIKKACFLKILNENNSLV